MPHIQIEKSHHRVLSRGLVSTKIGLTVLKVICERCVAGVALLAMVQADHLGPTRLGLFISIG